MPSSNGRTDRSRVQSVERALAVLAALSDERSGLGIVELSQRVALPISSVHRLLSTLGDHGFVSQDVLTGHYRIGFRAFEVGNAFLQHSHLRDIAQPHLHELSSLTKETVNLALREGAFASYVEQIQSQHPFRVVPRPGARVPLHCSGVGKVFLAGMTADELEQTIKDLEMTPWTTHSITDRRILRRSLEPVRIQGFALDDEEMQLGVRCVASPIYNHLSETAAAISITAPAIHLSDEALPHVVSQLRRVASVVSEQLGYRSH